MSHELECAACSHQHPLLLLIAFITALAQQHISKAIITNIPSELPTNSIRDTTQLSHSDSPNYRIPHIEGQEQVQSHISHKSAHHRTYQISPNTTPPGVLTLNSRTYTMQEASGRERFSGKNLNKCPQKKPNNSPPREQSTPLTL